MALSIFLSKIFPSPFLKNFVGMVYFWSKRVYNIDITRKSDVNAVKTKSYEKKEKHTRPDLAMRWVMFGVIAFLALALVGSAIFGVVTANKNKQLTASNVSQQQLISQYEQSAASTDTLLKEQQSKITDLESKTASQDNAIQEYQQDISEITSNYNKLVQTKKQSGSTAAPKYAISAVTEKTCYLTFDDGPSDNTLKVLDILKQYNVKATFFVMGTGKLSYVKRIHEEGHTVALHTYSHTYSDIYRSQKAYFDDLNRISAAVKQYIDVDPKVIRFPGGSSNTVSKSYCTGIMTALSQETLNQGYVYFDWNVDSTDASGNNVSVSKIMHNIKTYGGRNKQDVVLMHDTGSKNTTVQALPQIIEYYIDKGYTFAPLTTSTPQVKHGVRN